MLRCAVSADGETAPGDRAEYPEGEIEERPPELLEQDGHLDGSGAGPAVLFGGVQAEPALSSQLVVDITRRTTLPIAFPDVLPADLFLTEFPDRGPEHLLLGCEIVLDHRNHAFSAGSGRSYIVHTAETHGREEERDGEYRNGQGAGLEAQQLGTLGPR